MAENYVRQVLVARHRDQDSERKLCDGFAAALDAFFLCKPRVQKIADISRDLRLQHCKHLISEFRTITIEQ